MTASSRWRDATGADPLQESVLIEATPERIYDAVSDVSRMGEWSPEATGGEYLTSGPVVVGSRFRGTNRNNRRKWSTVCTVVAAEPGRRFAFEVRAVGGPISRWEYDLTEEGGGTRVVEIWTDQRQGVHGAAVTAVARLLIGAPMDRKARNRAAMRETLANLKKSMERVDPEVR